MFNYHNYHISEADRHSSWTFLFGGSLPSDTGMKSYNFEINCARVRVSVEGLKFSPNEKRWGKNKTHDKGQICGYHYTLIRIHTLRVNTIRFALQ